MDAGKLDSRIEIKTLTETSDGYGGTSSSIINYATIWGNVREVTGDVSEGGLDRGRRKEINVIIRSKTFEDKNITEDNVLRIEGETGEYRITSIMEHTYKRYMKITAIKTF